MQAGPLAVINGNTYRLYIIVKQPRRSDNNASFDHTVTLAGHPAVVLDPADIG